MKRNIAKDIITKCGDGDFTAGVGVIATWCERHVSNVYRWSKTGKIPIEQQWRILAFARTVNKDLTEKDFF